MYNDYFIFDIICDIKRDNFLREGAEIFKIGAKISQKFFGLRKTKNKIIFSFWSKKIIKKLLLI